MSVTEGEDKPLKHPTIFNGADVAVVTKNELADAVEFDWNAARTSIQAVRPGIQVFPSVGENRPRHGRMLGVSLAATLGAENLRQF
jgi:Ni2+-binding GTPase involved in maturation of urease and hydrogenase